MLLKPISLARIACKDGVTPEDVFSPGLEPAALVDCWGRAYRLGRRFVVGRSQQHVDLVIRDDAVSMVHAELSFDMIRKNWVVADRASTNGTFVDGTRVEGSVCLHNLQVVEFGDVRLLFVLLEASGSLRRSRWD